MAPRDSIESRLGQSAAMASLISEQRVATDLDRLRWSALHGALYVDHETQKIREIDVIGRQTWQRTLRRGRQYANLYLICEVKSIKGWNILLSPARDYGYLSRLHYEWLGQEDRQRTALTAALLESGVYPDLARSLLERFYDAAYPNGVSWVRSLLVEPLKAPLFATAFRETNIGTDKELDASVLWRGGQALRSIVTSLRADSSRLALQSISDSVKYATDTKRVLTEAVWEELQIHLGFVSAFHPVLIVDAPLWMVRGKRLRAVDWCRFVQVDPHGSPTWWFDIVASSFAATYLKAATRHYAAQFRRVKATTGTKRRRRAASAAKGRRNAILQLPSGSAIDGTAH